ncbi:MAG: hypothetical protein RL695_1318 [Pseudomonadota bacterium]|jgi:hypothetical protein
MNTKNTTTAPATPRRTALKPVPQPWNLRLVTARQLVTDMTIEKLTAARDAVVQLKAEGFVVFGAQIDSVRPTVQVEAGRLTTRAIDEERACYYKWLTRDGQQERHGQFNLDGVRVVWVERL